MVTTRVPGKFGLVLNFCSKVLVPDTKIWSKRSLRACSRILAALPGAQHVERCFARNERLYMACRDGRQYFFRGRSGGNLATRVGEVFRSKVSFREGYLKISRDPLGTFCGGAI